MADQSQSTRRDFLTTSARLAGIAGLAATAGCSMTGGGAGLAVTAGPAPRPIGPDASIRLGLIGTGGRGREILKPALKQKNIEVKAIADPNEPNRQKCLAQVREALGQTPEIYDGPEGYKKLLAREDIDACILATPPNLHAEMYLACFAAGKHFYGEKPMCIEKAEADALVKAQEKNPKVVAQIGFQRRGSARYHEGIKLIHDGVIGRPTHGRGAWNNCWGPLGLPDQGTAVWFGRSRQSGDWMLEQACHTWDVLNWVAGTLPVAASGMGVRGLFKDKDPDRDVTDYYLAHLEYPNEFYVTFEHSWICPQRDEGRFFGIYERVSGPKGGICLDEGKVFWRDAGKNPETLKSPGGEPYMTENSMAEFFKSVRTGTAPVSGVVNGRMATLVGLLVRKAVYEHRRVLMSEIA